MPYSPGVYSIAKPFSIVAFFVECMSETWVMTLYFPFSSPLTA